MHVNRSISSSIYDQALQEAFNRLQQMSDKMLRKLNDNPMILKEFIQELSMIKTMENTRQELIKRNRQLALKNLKREPELIENRKKLMQILLELESLREKYLVLRRENDDDTRSGDVILGQLKSLLHENERLNDEMIETFFHTCRNEQDVEIFIKNFLFNRQKTVELRVITEKFTLLYQIEKQKR